MSDVSVGGGLHCSLSMRSAVSTLAGIVALVSLDIYQRVWFPSGDGIDRVVPR